MTIILKTIALGFLCMQFMACDVSVNNNHNSNIEKTIKKESRFANAKDYNCGMNTEDSYTDTTIYKGKTYGFCSASCKREFDKKPDTFVAK